MDGLHICSQKWYTVSGSKEKRRWNESFCRVESEISNVVNYKNGETLCSIRSYTDGFR